MHFLCVMGGHTSVFAFWKLKIMLERTSSPRFGLDMIMNIIGQFHTLLCHDCKTVLIFKLSYGNSLHTRDSPQHSFVCTGDKCMLQCGPLNVLHC